MAIFGCLDCSVASERGHCCRSLIPPMAFLWLLRGYSLLQTPLRGFIMNTRSTTSGRNMKFINHANTKYNYLF